MDFVRTFMRGAYLCLALLSGCVATRGTPNSSVKRAEELAQQGKYQESIEEYRAHIASRLGKADRASWENPHFYLLLIGDSYLKLNQPAEAEKAFEEAEQNNVEQDLVSDRYRALAEWYIQEDRLQSAMELLKKHRQLDPLLFDGMLNEVSRAITEKEEQRRQN